MSYISFLFRNFRFLSYSFSLNVFLGLGQTYYISLFNADLQAELSLSHGELAAIYGAATITSSILLLFVGHLLDTVDLRWFSSVATLLVGGACYAIANIDSTLMLFAAVCGLRFSALGLWGLTSATAPARYFDNDRGKATSIGSAGMAMGYAILPFIGAWLISSFGWREAWIIAALFVMFVVLPLVHIQLWRHGERHRRYVEMRDASLVIQDSPQVRQWTVIEVLKDRQFYLVQPALLFVPSIVFNIQFHQLHLVEIKGWGLDSFTAAYVIFAVTSLVANISGGFLVDRYSTRSVLSWYLLPLVPALAAVWLFSHPVVIIALMVGTGASFGLSLVVYNTLWAEVYGTKSLGAVRAINACINPIVASIAMAGTGWLIDEGINIDTQCLAFLGVLLVSGFVSRNAYVNRDPLTPSLTPK